jgi:hypothetical protein
MRLRLLVVLTAALVAGHAEAKYSAIGLGNASCGTWGAARRDRRATGYEQWVVGFLSGIGYEGATGGADPLNGVVNPSLAMNKMS